MDVIHNIRGRMLKTNDIKIEKIELATTNISVTFEVQNSILKKYMFFLRSIK